MKARALAVPVGLCTLLGILGGCGSSQRHDQAAVHARRASLVVAAHALLALERPVSREVAAANTAWPYIDRGLPQRSKHPSSRKPMPDPTSRAGRAAIGIAARRAHRLPAMLVANGEALVGPGAEAAQLYQSYSGLSEHGWSHIKATVGLLGSEPAAIRAYLRANLGTYIFAVYDGHFDLSEIGKTLGSAYKRLGGGGAFGRNLTESEVSEIERAYSPAGARLNPHPWQAVLHG